MKMVGVCGVMTAKDYGNKTGRRRGGEDADYDLLGKLLMREGRENSHLAAHALFLLFVWQP